MSNFQLKLPDAYIYLYHTDEYFILPQYPESLHDTLNSTFSEQNALSRTAPVFSYSNSGPRSILISLKLHRDMMNDINRDNRSVSFTDESDEIIRSIDDDYVDILIKKLQAIALPRYDASSKLVDPPRVALRFGNEIFIKGVVASGGIGISHELPILANNKYAIANISFTVSETQPYDAISASQQGGFRNIPIALQSKLHRIGDKFSR